MEFKDSLTEYKSAGLFPHSYILEARHQTTLASLAPINIAKQTLAMMALSQPNLKVNNRTTQCSRSAGDVQ